MTPNKMPVYINAAASVSALGRSELLQSDDFVYRPQRLSDDGQLFQSVKDCPVSQSRERLYQLLTEVIDSVISQLALTSEQLSQITLFLGSSSLDISTAQLDVSKVIWLPQLDAINIELTKKYGFSALNFTFNTACTASANALIYATKFIENGDVKQALVVGCEFFNQLTLKGFSSLELISEQGQYSLSSLRDGLVLGEGVGALLLSSEKAPTSSLQVLGGYSSCDTYSLTTTQEDGSHIQSVISKSLALAGISLAEVDLIKVHATASHANDQAEVAAITALFKDIPAVFALKPYIGHTLGACGVLEIAIMAQLLALDYLPVPEYAVAQAECNMLPFVPQGSSFTDYRIILANHFGFGGNNAAIILKKITSISEAPQC